MLNSDSSFGDNQYMISFYNNINNRYKSEEIEEIKTFVRDKNIRKFSPSQSVLAYQTCFKSARLLIDRCFNFYKKGLLDKDFNYKKISNLLFEAIFYDNFCNVARIVENEPRIDAHRKFQFKRQIREYISQDCKYENCTDLSWAINNNFRSFVTFYLNYLNNSTVVDDAILIINLNDTFLVSIRNYSINFIKLLETRSTWTISDVILPLNNPNLDSIHLHHLKLPFFNIIGGENIPSFLNDAQKIAVKCSKILFANHRLLQLSCGEITIPNEIVNKIIFYAAEVDDIDLSNRMINTIIKAIPERNAEEYSDLPKGQLKQLCQEISFRKRLIEEVNSHYTVTGASTSLEK